MSLLGKRKNSYRNSKTNSRKNSDPDHNLPNHLISSYLKKKKNDDNCLLGNYKKSVNIIDNMSNS